METVTKKFNQIGARVKVFHQGDPETLRRTPVTDIGINVLNDKEGEFFDITIENPGRLKLEVLDTQKKDRHLLLMAKTKTANNKIRKMKFLCGYDERHFFSCAIPESAGASTVLQAKQALKPSSILDAERGIKRKNLHKRHKKIKNGKIHRQGEFFFIPEPSFNPVDEVIHKKEPMRRSNQSKSHTAEFLIRYGGETVYVCSQHRSGLTEKEHKKLLKEDPDAKRWTWTPMTINPDVFVKGKITHSDHKTLDLGNTWHKMTLNTEDKAWASQKVTFLD